MTTLHFVKKARKTFRGTGIKRGDAYFWWAFRNRSGPSIIHRSKEKPRRSRLTRSEFEATLWNAEDSVAAAVVAFRQDGDHEALREACEDAADSVEEAGEECASKRDNMPEGLQDCGTGELLGERAEACERIVQDLRSAAFTNEDENDREETASEVEGISWGVS